VRGEVHGTLCTPGQHAWTFAHTGRSFMQVSASGILSMDSPAAFVQEWQPRTLLAESASRMHCSTCTLAWTCACAWCCCKTCLPAVTDSQGVKALVRAMMRRGCEQSSLEDVLRHPYFTKNLPHGALSLSDDVAAAASTCSATEDAGVHAMLEQLLSYCAVRLPTASNRAPQSAPAQEPQRLSPGDPEPVQPVLACQ
jgi:hypothetical protein